jgi:peroxiredoxin Q/BCP
MDNVLKVGDKAPSFSGKDQLGNTVKLSDFKDKKLVLYFYPKDNTPGCTAQACNLTDNYTLLLKNGYTVVGVSPDNLNAHQKFSQQYKLPFPILPDPELKIIKRYGVWGEKQLYGRKFMGLHRTTFIIENGVITRIIKKPKTKEHAEEILNS